MICTESPISSEDIYNNDLINNINIKDLIKINDFEYDQDNHDLDLFNNKIDILESFNEKENIKRIYLMKILVIIKFLNWMI